MVVVHSPPSSSDAPSWSLRLLLSVVLVAALTGVYAVTAGSASAYVKPPTAWSWYMTSADINRAYTLGCNQGHADTSNGASSRVSLHYGVQTNDGSGAYLSFGGYISGNDIVNTAAYFAGGYSACVGNDTSRLYLSITTNNWSADAGNDVNNHLFWLGYTWGDFVERLKGRFGSDHTYQVVGEGGIDIEDWQGEKTPSTPGPTRHWTDGYAYRTPAAYINTGSANGCPAYSRYDGQNRYCQNGWDREAYWYVSWGNPRALPAPQIFNADMPWQWAGICLWGAAGHGNACRPTAPLDEHPLNTGTSDENRAYADLAYTLAQNPATNYPPPFSMEMHVE